MIFHNRVDYEVGCNWKVYIDNFLEGYHLPHVHPGLSRVLDYRSYDDRALRLVLAPALAAAQRRRHLWRRRCRYFFVYPNIMLNVMPARLQTNGRAAARPRPLQGRLRLLLQRRRRARSGSDLEFSDEIQQEDIDICERVQRGLLSGGYVPGRLSPKREAGVWHFQNLLRRAYRGVGTLER